MAKINEAERKTQDRVLDLFRAKETLDYEYYGDLRHQINTNIIIDKLTAFLIGRYSKSLSAKAIDKPVSTAGNLQQGLYKANQEVYSLLKYGAKVKEEHGE
jgi:type I restriction enzyme R subunit